MCKGSLNKEGVMYWNTTGCKDVIYTAAHAFQSVVTFDNFVAASDKPFLLDKETKRKAFLDCKRYGKSLFLKNDKRRFILDRLINTPLINIRDSILNQKLWLITDDNMASEYKEGIWHKSK